jgi:putative Mg2+ transporter-C (MgtC) family protein
MMVWTDFTLRLMGAFTLGSAIGLERQWRQRMAGLRTTALVSTGASLFVMLSVLTPGDASPTRVAAQIVSGIGFLCGGVILRDGASIRGLNTAATIWCAAAIGSYLAQDYFPMLLSEPSLY